MGRYLDEISRHALLTPEEEVELAQSIEAGVRAQRTLHSDEPETPARRRELEEQVRRSAAAKERFVSANLRLVVANARRYVPPPGVELLDLIQEGNLGLVHAVEKFDWRKGFRFSTYATWWIRQAISKALAEKGRVIRLPGPVNDSVLLVQQSQATLSGVLGRPPDAEEIAAAAGLEVARVEAALRVPATMSLQAPVGDEGSTLGEFIADRDPQLAEIEVEIADVATRLRQAIQRLPEREARIISLRYGLADGTPRPLESIGSEFGLTAERIRQLAKRALCRLRHPAFGLREADYL